jgi:hypothetical protein
MRTTLTLDDDVAAELERLRKTRDASLKEVVNDVLRLGLREIDTRARPHEPFRTRSVDLGAPRVANIDNIAEVLAVFEGEAFK